MRARNLARDVLVLALGCAGAAEIAKFTAFLDHWVWFPSWPVLVDLAVLAVNVGGFLGFYVGIRRSHKA